MLALKPTAISGGSRPSLFGSSVKQSQGFRMGTVPLVAVTPAEWYNRAKEAVAKYEDLIVRAGRIANTDARKAIQDWAGSTIVSGTPANRYQLVLTDIREDVESFIPANVNAYQVSDRTDKILDLEDVNKDLEAMVSNASADHGVLPVSQGVVPPPAAPEPGNWVLPIVVVTGALGIAALVTYIYGGKA